MDKTTKLKAFVQPIYLEYTLWCGNHSVISHTVKPVCKDHLYNKIYYM